VRRRRSLLALAFHGRDALVNSAEVFLERREGGSSRTALVGDSRPDRIGRLVEHGAGIVAGARSIAHGLQQFCVERQLARTVAPGSEFAIERVARSSDLGVRLGRGHPRDRETIGGPALRVARSMCRVSNAMAVLEVLGVRGEHGDPTAREIANERDPGIDGERLLAQLSGERVDARSDSRARRQRTQFVEPGGGRGYVVGRDGRARDMFGFERRSGLSGLDRALGAGCSGSRLRGGVRRQRLHLCDRAPLRRAQDRLHFAL